MPMAIKLILLLFLFLPAISYAQSVTGPQHTGAPLNVTDGSTSCYPYSISVSPGSLSCANGIASLTSGGGSGNVGIGTVNNFAGYVGVSTIGPFQTVEVAGNVGIGTTKPISQLDITNTSLGNSIRLYTGTPVDNFRALNVDTTYDGSQGMTFFNRSTGSAARIEQYYQSGADTIGGGGSWYISIVGPNDGYFPIDSLNIYNNHSSWDGRVFGIDETDNFYFNPNGGGTTGTDWSINIGSNSATSRGIMTFSQDDITPNASPNNASQILFNSTQHMLTGQSFQAFDLENILYGTSSGSPAYGGVAIQNNMTYAGGNSDNFWNYYGYTGVEGGHIGRSTTFYIDGTVVNTGAGASVDTAEGIFIEDQNQGATESYAIHTNQSSAAKSWAQYNEGTAKSYFAGNIGIGTTIPQGALTVMSGNVGIGTWKPSTLLQVGPNSATSGQVRLPYGAAATPSIVWTGNGDAGIYGINGTNSLGISAGNVTSAVFAGDTITLGDTDPTHTLDLTVQGGGAVDRVGMPLRIAAGAGAGAGLPGYISFRTSTAQGSGSATQTLSERARIDPNGNLGIGTVTPVARLAVVGNVGIGSTATSPYITNTPYSGNNQPPGMIVEGNVGIGTWGKYNGGQGSGVLMVYAKEGTATPTLTVTSVSSTDDAQGIIDYEGSGTAQRARMIVNNGNVVTGQFIASGSGSGSLADGPETGNQGGLLFSGSSLSSAYIYTSTADPLYLGTNNVIRQTILSGGNVGIGSQNPGQKLDVAGNIRVVTGVYAATQASPPTIASNDCGTLTQGTVTAGSSDLAGSATAGTAAGNVLSCAISFGQTHTTAPASCVCNDSTAPLALAATWSTTKVTCTALATLASGVLSYQCQWNTP